MELLLVLIYAAFAIGIFKLFKIPVNGFSLLTAALGGAAMLALLVLSMNYNHPFSSEGRFYFVTTPITPTVGGRVIEVPVVPNTPLKAGDVLFRIEPEKYQNAVKSKEAQLADATQAENSSSPPPKRHGKTPMRPPHPETEQRISTTARSRWLKKG